MNVFEALNAVEDYLIENGFVTEDATTADGYQGILAREKGVAIGTIALDPDYIKEHQSAGADVVEKDLLYQQAAQVLRRDKPAQNDKYLLLGKGSKGVYLVPNGSSSNVNITLKAYLSR